MRPTLEASGSTPIREPLAGLRTTLFAVTIGLSAFLLFSVQPMFARLVLPLLGGAPAVWNTAMAFFQVALLAGYAYAHGATRVAPAIQRPLQLALLCAGAFALPIALPADPGVPVDGSPIPWLLGTATTTIGLPFLALAANAPLMQAWFARASRGADPYFLYAASNIGSVAALLAYPLVIEPSLPLPDQARLWTLGYAALAVLIAGCALASGRESQVHDAAAEARATTPIRIQLQWIALAAIPSALLLGVTGHITTDIAAVPLLWIGPLALYLATFVIAFAARPPIAAATSLKIAPYAVVALVLGFWLPGAKWAAFALHLVGFFFLALACHGALVERRPPAGQLTRFYICLSAGGALGGTLTALAAPMVFADILEYPLAIAAACLALRAADAPRATWRDPAVGGAAAIGFLAVARLLDPGAGASGAVLGLAVVGLGAALVFATRARPARLAATVAAALLVAPVTRSVSPLLQERSFFGVFRVSDDADARHRLFWHGTTLHGVQATTPGRRRDTLVYYDKDGPVGQIAARFAQRLEAARIGVVGLGAGALACYARPGQDWTFIEIDPLVVRIARDSGLFTLLAECAPQARTVLGDGRLVLQREAAVRYDALIVDAFSSDGVPTHLLTREALALYRARLAPGGLLLLNLSNRFLALEPVLAATAAEAGLAGVAQEYRRAASAPGELAVAAHWAVLAAEPATLAPLAVDTRWRRLVADGRTRAWTDTYSNVFAALR
ncbi:MAG: fused MFS/spermidine synthase [Phreatobacter sp.]|uniref:spermidine synthase n=1 Tax=Phreatobacter sp. TaxID=1966341 RepID=UPI001A5A7244|nr:fused MFS/spermidine synthase [Phreatobacter sp.]MBL8571884.1 fused MFS/spermidine synthase [Phreatobacter sp.]